MISETASLAADQLTANGSCGFSLDDYWDCTIQRTGIYMVITHNEKHGGQEQEWDYAQVLKCLNEDQC